MSWGDYFTVSKKTFNERLSICNECDQYDKNGRTCKNCGCYMEHKARLRIVSCPLNKWLKEEIKNNWEEDFKNGPSRPR